MSHERCGPSQAPDQLLSKLPLCAMPVKGETPSALGLGPAGRGLPKAGQAGHAPARPRLGPPAGTTSEPTRLGRLPRHRGYVSDLAAGS
jgi:hypothetical protein